MTDAASIAARLALEERQLKDISARALRVKATLIVALTKLAEGR